PPPQLVAPLAGVLGVQDASVGPDGEPQVGGVRAVGAAGVLPPECQERPVPLPCRLPKRGISRRENGSRPPRLPQRRPDRPQAETSGVSSGAPPSSNRVIPLRKCIGPAEQRTPGCRTASKRRPHGVIYTTGPGHGATHLAGTRTRAIDRWPPRETPCGAARSTLTADRTTAPDRLQPISR